MLGFLDNILKPAKKQNSAKTAPGGIKDGQGTRLSSNWATVRARLQELGAKHVFIHGDAAALASAKTELPGMALNWISLAAPDLEAGAKHAEDQDWTSADAVICAGSELTGRYRQALRLMAAADATKPVFWIGNGFEYCGGTLSAPAEADEVEGLLYNHFLEFFGVKDPLQFRIEIYHGPEVKRYYRILEPNQSHVIRLSDHFKDRKYAVSLAAFVEHPVLTRDRHYRLRLCADVFWKDSLTTLHSAHEFNRDPDHKVEFRAPAWLVRDGAMVLTLPNYERKAAPTDEVEAIAGSTSAKAPRHADRYIDQSAVRRGNVGEDQVFGWRYRGFGGSNWFALEGGEVLGNGHSGNIAGNHHASCPVLDRPGLAATPEDIAKFAALEAAGYILEPHAVPIAQPGSRLEFGYESDTANPRLPYLRIDYFDAGGAHLGHHRFKKERPGPLFTDDMLRLWNNPSSGRARLALVSFDFQRGGLQFKKFKPMANLLIRDRKTLDQDVTEFQSSWRNLGGPVPGFPHWLTDQLATVGRTNLFGRVRCDRKLRTGVALINASGRLNYRKSARTDLIVINNQGERIQKRVDIPAFAWGEFWFDELMPGLAEHLGSSGNGTLLVQSGDADLNAEIITTNPAGAVALQHLWGY